jgi:hypothetical protein
MPESSVSLGRVLVGLYVKQWWGRRFLWALGYGERHDVTHPLNRISADRRGLTLIVASVIIPKRGNHQRG